MNYANIVLALGKKKEAGVVLNIKMTSFILNQL